MILIFPQYYYYYVYRYGYWFQDIKKQSQNLNHVKTLCKLQHHGYNNNEYKMGILHKILVNFAWCKRKIMNINFVLYTLSLFVILYKKYIIIPTWICVHELVKQGEDIINNSIMRFFNMIYTWPTCMWSKALQLQFTLCKSISVNFSSGVYGK